MNKKNFKEHKIRMKKKKNVQLNYQMRMKEKPFKNLVINKNKIQEYKMKF